MWEDVMKPMPATDSEEEHEDITQRTNEDNRYVPER